MLLQAIAVARAGQFLMVDGALKPFFVVAIYLCANLTAERYVITNTTLTEEGEEVCYTVVLLSRVFVHATISICSDGLEG